MILRSRFVRAYFFYKRHFEDPIGPVGFIAREDHLAVAIFMQEPSCKRHARFHTGPLD